jgi:glutamine amidotransferase
MIAIIDYGAGNLRSIRRAIEAVGADATITADAEAIRDADAVVLPGVGAAGHAMNRLEELGMTSAIRQTVEAGKPFLGICLGMQVMFDEQEEGSTSGLGLLRGRVHSLTGPVKVPHIGWSRSRVARPGPIGKPGDEPYYYFVHSYIADPRHGEDVAATAFYGEEFASIVIRDNVWGTQFHPEKSGPDGIALIREFVRQVVPSPTASETSR